MTVSWKEGDHFPEGGSYTLVELDLCNKCKEDLKAYLKENYNCIEKNVHF